METIVVICSIQKGKVVSSVHSTRCVKTYIEVSPSRAPWVLAIQTLVVQNNSDESSSVNGYEEYRSRHSEEVPYNGRITQYCNTPHFMSWRKCRPSCQNRTVNQTTAETQEWTQTFGFHLTTLRGNIHFCSLSPRLRRDLSCSRDNPFCVIYVKTSTLKEASRRRTLRNISFCSSKSWERYVSNK